MRLSLHPLCRHMEACLKDKGFFHLSSLRKTYMPASALFLISLLAFSEISKADLLKLQDLNFGNLMILDNKEPHSFTLKADGTTEPSEYIFLMDSYANETGKPTPGKFKIDALPEHSQISVKAENIKLEAETSDNYFLVKDIVISTAQTDENGEVLFFLGGTLETSGNGIPYAEDIYSGLMPLTVSY